MCYSAEVSGGTFLFVTSICGILWIRNKGLDRPLAGILFFIGLMQALEWFLWTNLECNSINKAVSFSIPIYLALQPVVANLLVWYYNAGWGSGYLQIALISLAVLPVLLWQNLDMIGSCATLNTSKNLIWPGVPNNTPLGFILRMLYYITLLYPLVTLKNSVFSGLYVVFAGLTLYLFGLKSQKSWPSLWCHFVNFLSVFALIRPSP